jgi:hypothetical protein
MVTYVSNITRAPNTPKKNCPLEAKFTLKWSACQAGVTDAPFPHEEFGHLSRELLSCQDKHAAFSVSNHRARALGFSIVTSYFTHPSYLVRLFLPTDSVLTLLCKHMRSAHIVSCHANIPAIRVSIIAR